MQPFSKDFARKTFGHLVNPCKHLQCNFELCAAKKKDKRLLMYVFCYFLFQTLVLAAAVAGSLTIATTAVGAAATLNGKSHSRTKTEGLDLQ